MPDKPNPKIVYIVTVPMTAKLLMRGHLNYMQQQGFDVTVISSPGEELAEVTTQELVTTIGIPIQREISLFADLVSLWQIYKALRKIKPDIVNASTPKAGFLGMLAAWAARVPVRIYLLRGLRAETAVGTKKIILNTTERIASFCAHHVAAVSKSLSLVYSQEKLVNPIKITIIGDGSSNGVNPDKFLPNENTYNKSNLLRQELNLTPNTPVIGFVGRFTKDKGIIELVSAFKIIQQTLPLARLLLVGDFEVGDPLPPEMVEEIESDPSIISTGFVKDTSPYYPLMQIFVFPSYREGFPNAPLEAALAGIPTIGFAATGVIDAIQDGITGVVIKLRDTNTLATEILKLSENPTQLNLMGEAAKNRAINDFSPKTVWANWHQFYIDSLAASSSSKF
jgi:glycosyltransferase involved in cell wall biosynthesis